MCQSEGKKNGCCHCWSSDGKPKSYEDDCHEPPNCLAYSVKDSGHFKFGALQGHDSLEHVLADGTRAVLRLPRAGDQEELFAAGLETESERRSWLLARVLVQYGERPGPFDLDFARGLAVGARNALEAALDAALPRLDLGMEVHCASCGHGFEAPFDVASFFLPR